MPLDGHPVTTQWNYPKAPMRPQVPGAVRSRVGSGRSIVRRVDGDGLTPPCMEMRGYGIFTFLWPVSAGTRILSVWCKHSEHTPRPRVRVLPNPDIGVTTEVSVESSPTSDWHQLQLSVTPTGDGVLEVWLEVLAWDGAAWARWDRVEVS